MLPDSGQRKDDLGRMPREQPSKQSFHCWKREFGMIDVNQAKRMKELFEGEHAAKTDAGRQAAGDRDLAGDA